MKIGNPILIWLRAGCVAHTPHSLPMQMRCVSEASAVIHERNGPDVYGNDDKSANSIRMRLTITNQSLVIQKHKDRKAKDAWTADRWNFLY